MAHDLDSIPYAMNEALQLEGRGCEFPPATELSPMKTEAQE